MLGFLIRLWARPCAWQRTRGMLGGGAHVLNLDQCPLHPRTRRPMHRRLAPPPISSYISLRRSPPPVLMPGETAVATGGATWRRGRNWNGERRSDTDKARGNSKSGPIWPGNLWTPGNLFERRGAPLQNPWAAGVGSKSCTSLAGRCEGTEKRARGIPQSGPIWPGN